MTGLSGAGLVFSGPSMQRFVVHLSFVVAPSLVVDPSLVVVPPGLFVVPSGFVGFCCVGFSMTGLFCEGTWSEPEPDP